MDDQNGGLPKLSRVLRKGSGVDIANKQQHRALAFVQACNAGGYRPTRRELQQWIETPGLQLKNPMRMAESIRSQMERMAFGPAEEIDAGLDRLQWISATADGRLKVTELGRALLRHAETSPEPDEEVIEIFLNRDDQLAYPQLIGTIADLGSGLLVDAYLGLQELSDCIVQTSIDRYLVSKTGRGRTAAIAAMGTLVAGNAAVQVRTSDEIHDRLVIPDHGDNPIRTLGTSLNGVGRKKITVFSKPSEIIASALRGAYAEIWERACTINTDDAAIADVAESAGQSAATTEP